MTAGNAAALLAAAQRKSAAAHARAEAGIRALMKAREPITFESVATTAHVSKDYLYRTADLRDRIATLRARTTSTRPATAVDLRPEESPSSVVRTLTAKLGAERARHRAELADLHRALEAAHNELLRLRRIHGVEATTAVGASQ